MRCYVGSLRHPSVDGWCDVPPRVPRARVFARPTRRRIRWTLQDREETCLVHARDDWTVKVLFRVHSNAKAGDRFGGKLVGSCALCAPCVWSSGRGRVHVCEFDAECECVCVCM